MEPCAQRCYNANPTAVRAAIDLVAQLNGYRRKWLVLGDMLELGPQEAELHGEIGSLHYAGLKRMRC